MTNTLDSHVFLPVISRVTPHLLSQPTLRAGSGFCQASKYGLPAPHPNKLSSLLFPFSALRRPGGPHVLLQPSSHTQSINTAHTLSPRHSHVHIHTYAYNTLVFHTCPQAHTHTHNSLMHTRPPHSSHIHSQCTFIEKLQFYLFCPNWFQNLNSVPHFLPLQYCPMVLYMSITSIFLDSAPNLQEDKA